MNAPEACIKLLLIVAWLWVGALSCSAAFVFATDGSTVMIDDNQDWKVAKKDRTSIVQDIGHKAVQWKKVDSTAAK